MKRAAWITLFAGALAASGAGLAGAQPKPAPSASASASAAPSGAPSAAPSPAGTSAMPPGHPPVKTVVDDDSGSKTQGHGDQDPTLFMPPEDTAVDDPTLPPGTIVVSIQDAKNRAIPHARITLGILHSTVAKGESRERRSAEADAGGTARFDGLAVGSGHSYRVTTTRGGATYGTPPVGVTDRAGKRIVLHAYETSQKIEDLRVAMQALFYISLRDDAIQIEQMLNVYNVSPVAWTADTTFELPGGFRAFNKQDAGGEARVDEVPGVGAALRGTFQPGRHDLDFRYQVPLRNDDSQTFTIRLPPHVAAGRVLLEASKTMSLTVRDFPAAQRTTGRDGRRLLVTEYQATRGTGGVREVVITVSGLPTRPGRWIALAAAVLVLAAGVYYFTQHKDGEIDDDTRGDLIEAREALLGEIVALERAFKAGDIGPKTYARVRASLVEALGRILAMLDEARRARAGNDGAASGPKPPRAKPARREKAAEA